MPIVVASTPQGIHGTQVVETAAETRQKPPVLHPQVGVAVVTCMSSVDDRGSVFFFFFPML